jgi:tetratricopeptide (TPR) repeat protein
LRKLLYILIFLLLVPPVTPQSPVDSILNIVAITDNDSVKVEALLALSRIFFSRNLQQSVEYGQQAVELAEKTGSLHLQSWALTTLGAAHYYLGDYNQALEEWMASVEILKTRESRAPDSITRSDLTDQRAFLLNNIGVVYKTMGEYDKAIEYYQENLRLQEQIGNTLQEAQARSNIANVYFAFEIDFEKALEQYKESLDLFLKYNK